MKRYLTNLWQALTGSNPYQRELDEKTIQLLRSSENIRGLNDLYYDAVEKWKDAEHRSNNLQRLVEHLRGRIEEMKAEMEMAGQEFRKRMERTKADYQHRLDDYNLKIEELTRALPS